MNNLVNHVFYCITSRPLGPSNFFTIDRNVVVYVHCHDVTSTFLIWSLNFDLDVKSARSQNRWINQIFSIGCTNDNHIAELFNTIKFSEKLRHDRGFHVRGDSCPTCSEHRIHLVEKDDDRPTFGTLFASSLKHQTNLPLGLPHVFIQQFWTLDVEKIRATFVRPSCESNFLGKAICNCLGDKCLSATWWAIQKDSFGRLKTELTKKCLMQER